MDAKFWKKRTQLKEYIFLFNAHQPSTCLSTVSTNILADLRSASPGLLEQDTNSPDNTLSLSLNLSNTSSQHIISWCH